MNADETTRRRSNARPLAEFVADFPISEASQAQYLASPFNERDPLAGRTRRRSSHCSSAPAIGTI